MEKWIDTEVSDLLNIAGRLQPEGEPLDLRDREYTPEEMAQMRSYLSRQRKSIDLINAALARAWQLDHTDEVWDDGANEWSVRRAKTRTVIDNELFMRYVSDLSLDELEKAFSAGQLGRVIKVRSLGPTMRETLLDETEIHDRLSIESKPVEMDMPETK